MKVGVVGSGSIGRRHLENLLALGYLDLTLVSEKKKLEKLEISGVEISCVSSYDQFLETSAESVIICNPTSMHEEYLYRALNAKKNVLLEKPASTCSYGLERITESANHQAVTVGLVHQFRFEEGIERLQTFLKSGQLGELLHVSAVQGEHIADYNPDQDYRQSYAARKDLGGGVLLTQIHQIDLLNWLFGPFESVYGIGGNSGRLQMDVEDHSSFLLKNFNGLPVYGHVDYLLRPKTMKISVAGTQGTLEWSYYDSRLTLMQPDDVVQKELARWEFDRNSMFRKLLQDFFDSVASRARPRSDLSDGIKTLRIVEAVKRSMSLGTVEQIG